MVGNARSGARPCHSVSSKGDAMSFAIYAAGYVLVIGGLIYGAHLMRVPAHWIVMGAIVMLGLGVLSGVKATHQRDPS